MARGDTRERLLQVALEQFAVRGYSGTSIRDLAAAAGIKESSVYKHFVSKQAIFDELLIWTQARYADAQRALGLSPDSPAATATTLGRITAPDITGMALALYDFSITDEVAVGFRRLLTVEQYREPRASELLRSTFLQGPIDFQADVFAALMRAGAIKTNDPYAVALAFWGPIWLLICAAGAGGAGGQAEHRAALMAHLEQFHETHGLGSR